MMTCETIWALEMPIARRRSQWPVLAVPTSDSWRTAKALDGEGSCGVIGFWLFLLFFLSLRLGEGGREGERVLRVRVPLGFWLCFYYLFLFVLCISIKQLYSLAIPSRLN